jgi:hypothetical protein
MEASHGPLKSFPKMLHRTKQPSDALSIEMIALSAISRETCGRNDILQSASSAVLLGLNEMKRRINNGVHFVCELNTTF